MSNYTLAQAQSDVSALRGQIAHLQAYAKIVQAVIGSSVTMPDGAVWNTAGLNALELVAQGSTPAFASPTLYTNSGGNLSFVSGTGTNTHVPQTAGDTTVRTVSGTTTDTQFSGPLPIPANDALVNTVYRIRLYGNGNQATTTGVNMTFGIHGFAQAPESGSRTGIAGGVGIAAGAAFTFWVEGLISVKTLGAGGTATFMMVGAAGSNGRTATPNIPMQAISTGTVSIDTTTATTMFLSCQLGSTTGSPTITGVFSTLERLGT